MTWEIDLKARTAETGGFAVKFSPMPASSKFSADCFRDPGESILRGKFIPSGEAMREKALCLADVVLCIASKLASSIEERKYD